MNRRSTSRATVQRPLRARFRQFAAEALLESAERTFSQRGFGARMEEIAAEAGVSVGTLYNHFQDRQALIDALLAARRQATLERVDAALASSGGRPFRERLRAVLEAMVETSGENIEFRRVLFEADLPGSVTRKAALARELSPRFTELFAQGHREGELSSDSHGRSPAFLIGLMSAALGMSLMAPERLSLADLPKVVLSQFLDGAAKKGASK